MALDLVTTAEAAQLKGWSVRTIHRFVDAGTLTPVVRAPGGRRGSYLFARADVEALPSKDAA